MAKYVLLKFKINNTFSEWEKIFYAAQPNARKMGINSITHSFNVNDKKSVMVLMTIDDEKTWENFFNENKDLISSSGHILETTVTEYYEN